MTVGERIKQKRIELGLTQQDLADKMGYKNKSAISRVERDYEQNLTLDRVALFAEALNVSPYYLMGWEDKEEEEIKNKLAVSLLHGDKLKQLAEAYDRADDRTKALVDMALGILPPDAVFPRSPEDNE